MSHPVDDSEKLKKLWEAYGGSPTGRLSFSQPEMQHLRPPRTELGQSILLGLKPVFQTHDYAHYDYSELETKLLAEIMQRPFFGISPVAELQHHKWRNRMHHHRYNPCEGTCQLCGEKIVDSHDERISKLEKKVEDLERNLRELAGVPNE